MKNKKWYSVKLIYVNRVNGKPIENLVDEHFKQDYIAYEERIVLVRAKSFGKAYKKAIKMAKSEEEDYENIYGQRVQFRYLDAVDCFELFDEKVRDKTEVYSCFMKLASRSVRRILLKKLFRLSLNPITC